MPRAPLIDGFAFTGYRSFGSGSLEAVSMTSAVHLLAGPNNSGKSNALSVVKRAISALKTGRPLEFDEVDRPLGASDNARRQLAISICFQPKEASDFVADQNVVATVGHLLREAGGIRNVPPGLWRNFILDERNRFVPDRSQVQRFAELIQARDELRTLRIGARLLSGRRGGGAEETSNIIFDSLHEALVQALPAVETIGAFRKIGQADPEGQGSFDGPGLIERLAELQNPGFVQPGLRDRFDRIVDFVKALFEDPDARLEVPNTRDTLLIRHQGRWLPIDNYGTGLHEVIILAAAATVLKETLVCVEEPEIHLHPTLQRRLLAYLGEQTDNQYLVATHSAHMLDSGRASISSIRLVEGQSVVDVAVEPAEVALISSELGARASDLVQANAVVWVEGPSDRVYISGWISATNPDLVMGVHYEVMYYGGSLLRHLAADDPAIKEFVNLPRINRNFGVVMDSDRESRHARINSTKVRVRDEIANDERAVVWVTSGYTIEDYVPKDMLCNAVKAIHRDSQCLWQGDKYQNPLDKKRVKGRSSGVDKTAVALEVMRQWPSIEPREWPHDLRKKAQDLAAMINRANE